MPRSVMVCAMWVLLLFSGHSHYCGDYLRAIIELIAALWVRMEIMEIDNA